MSREIDDAPEEIREYAYGIRASDVELRSVEWYWPHRIPLGKITVLDGPPGCGKSTMTLDLAARTTSGRPMPDGARGLEGTVVVCNLEDDASDTIVPRFIAAGGNPERLILSEAVRTSLGLEPMTLPDHVQLLEDLVREHRAVLVVIDPLMATLSGEVRSGIDHHVRRALAPLRSAAERTQSAWVIVRHLNKASKVSDPMLRGGGSIGIIGAARAGLMVGRDPDDPKRRVLAVTKANLAPDDQPSLAYRVATDQVHDVAVIEWEGVSKHTARDLLAEETEPRGAVADAAAVLREFLADGAQLADDCKRFCKEAGVAGRTLDRAKEAIGVVARPRMNGERKPHWWWSLPAEEERQQLKTWRSWRSTWRTTPTTPRTPRERVERVGVLPA